MRPRSGHYNPGRATRRERAAIAIEAVTKGYAGHIAVNELSLAVPRGSVFGLLGPNGAGKTTTLRMVMNVLAPDSGTIEILGRPADRAARDRIGYMPEERGLYPRMVLEDQLRVLRRDEGHAARRGAAPHARLAGARRARGQVAAAARQRALEGHAAEGPVHRHGAARSRDPDPRRADERPRPGRART